MPTKLTKTVTRETRSKDRRGRTLIVSLGVGDVLTFRLKGYKRKLSVSLGHCFNLAQLMTQENEYRAKMDAYNQKKKFGERVKKPKRNPAPFDKVYYKALNA